MSAAFSPGPRISHYLVNKTAAGIRPLRVPERPLNAALEPSYKLPEREGGHHLFLFYLLSSSMWKMIFTVSYLQSWIPCYFIPEQRHNREGLLFHAGGLFGLVQGRCECRGRVGSLCGAGGRW